MPVFAALATGLPVVIGALLGHVNEGPSTVATLTS